MYLNLAVVVDIMWTKQASNGYKSWLFSFTNIFIHTVRVIEL